MVLFLAGAVLLRFWTTSDLWLDEALTVDISKTAVSQIPGYLRRDGSPPLFYVLLHYWMDWFGTSDLAVRSLSGVIGVATMPVVWVAGKRIGGKRVGWAAVVFLASSPFAVYYDTEARMYALVAFLTAVGFLALDSALRKPSIWNLAAVSLVTAALLYTHYWALYLLAVVGLWLIWRALRSVDRKPAILAAGAMVLGGASFAPWLPIFIFQATHTGTPWTTPSGFTAVYSAITEFTGGDTDQGRLLALMVFALCGLGLFGASVDTRHIELDLATRRPARPLAIVVVGTLILAVIGGRISDSAFTDRYASVVFIPLLLLVALGVGCLESSKVRMGVLASAAVLGLIGAIPNITTNRTQAGQVASVINAQGRSGDVVGYCPDQLGPAVNRLLHSGFDQVTFPRGIGPKFVDWVDYNKAVRLGDPKAFAAKLEELAGEDHAIWVVWAPGYRDYASKCESIVTTLRANPLYSARQMVHWDPPRFYEPMFLTRFEPT